MSVPFGYPLYPKDHPVYQNCQCDRCRRAIVSECYRTEILPLRRDLENVLKTLPVGAARGEYRCEACRPEDV